MTAWMSTTWGPFIDSRRDAVSRMLKRLEGTVEVVRPDAGCADILVVIEGCATACADLSGLTASRIVILATREAVDAFHPDEIGETHAAP